MAPSQEVILHLIFNMKYIDRSQSNIFRYSKIAFCSQSAIPARNRKTVFPADNEDIRL